MGCIMSTENSYKVCVGDDVNGCKQHCERLASKQARYEILRKYLSLVDRYYEADYLYEENCFDYGKADELFEKLLESISAMEMYRATHNITTSELTAYREATLNIKKASSVADAVRLLGGNNA